MHPQPELTKLGTRGSYYVWMGPRCICLLPSGTVFVVIYFIGHNVCSQQHQSLNDVTKDVIPYKRNGSPLSTADGILMF